MAFDSPLFVGAKRIGTSGIARDPRTPASLESEVARLLDRLSEVGAELESLLAVDVLVEDEGSASADDLRDGLANLLPAQARPVVSVIPVAGLGGSAVRLQAIALPPGPGRQSGEGRFPSAASRGAHFALTSGGVAAGGLVEQSRVALAEAASHIAHLGGTRHDVILADIEYVVGGSRDEWEEAALSRAAFFTEPGPCATGITLTRVAAPGGAIQFRMLGVLGARAAGEVQDAWPDRPWTWPFPLPYRHGNRVGNLVVVGGQSSRGPHGTLMRGEDAPAQAAETVRSVASVLEELSSSLDEVVRLTAYYVGSDADYETVRSNIVSAMPRSDFDLSLARVDQLAHERMLVEIEGIAWSHTPPVRG